MLRNLIGRRPAHGSGRRSTRPTLEQLEDRLTPSGSSLAHHPLYDSPKPPAGFATHTAPLGGHAAKTGGSGGAVVLADPAAPPASLAQDTAVIDFRRLPADKAYTLNIEFEAANGTTFKQTYKVPAGTGPDVVRDWVLRSIPKANMTSNPRLGAAQK